MLVKKCPVSILHELLQQASTLGDEEFLEIGRIVVLHGLLASRIRDFVSHISSFCNECSESSGTAEALRLLPPLLQIVHPLLPREERLMVRRALENLATVQSFIRHAPNASWGVGGRENDGARKVVSVSYKGISEGGFVMDRRECRAADLNTLALTVKRTETLFLDVFAEVKELIIQAPRELLQELNALLNSTPRQ